MDTPQELTRKEFYTLAKECRDYAMRLANHDRTALSARCARSSTSFWPACARTTSLARG